MLTRICWRTLILAAAALILITTTVSMLLLILDLAAMRQDIVTRLNCLQRFNKTYHSCKLLFYGTYVLKWRFYCWFSKIAEIANYILSWTFLSVVVFLIFVIIHVFWHVNCKVLPLQCSYVIKWKVRSVFL